MPLGGGQVPSWSCSTDRQCELERFRKVVSVDPLSVACGCHDRTTEASKGWPLLRTVPTGEGTLMLGVRIPWGVVGDHFHYRHYLCYAIPVHPDSPVSDGL